MVSVVQLVRTSDCGSEGRRFDPDQTPKINIRGSRRLWVRHNISPQRRLRWRSEGCVVSRYDSVWKTRNGNASRVECLFKLERVIYKE